MVVSPSCYYKKGVGGGRGRERGDEMGRGKGGGENKFLIFFFVVQRMQQRTQYSCIIRSTVLLSLLPFLTILTELLQVQRAK